MRKGRPGYPLPAGELGADEIVCQLVYLPDRDEYWQALYAAVHYMSTWTAWERDDDHRGQDAAENWREAFELTSECWRMTCLTDITDRMDTMIYLLANQSACCGTTTIGPIVTVVTNIVPGVGDDPTEWGETAVVDWAEWTEYVCYHAHVYVDSLITGARAIDVAIALGSYTIDFFVGIMNFMQYLGLDQVLGLNQVMKVYDDFSSENDLTGWFTPLADKFEDARDDIVCAIVQGSSLSDAVEAAIDDNAVWVLFYNLTDYAAVQALIYEGTVDGSGYLPPIRRDDCIVCDFEQQGEEDLFIEWIHADNQAYDSGTKEWFVNPVSTGGCFRVEFKIWTDDTKTTEQPCRIVVTGCDGDTTCGGAYHNIGLLHPTTIWEFDHPPFPDVEDAAIDRYVHIHEQPGIEYDLTFKLYV